MRLLLCFLVASLSAVGCTGRPIKAYAGGDLPEKDVATVFDSTEAILVSVDGEVYHNGLRQNTTDRVGYSYHLAPGKRKIVVARPEITFLGREPSKDEGYRATFDVPLEAGKKYRFIVESLELNGEITWNVWMLDRSGKKVIAPTTPPRRGGRIGEIRFYLDFDLDQNKPRPERPLPEGGRA